MKTRVRRFLALGAFFVAPLLIAACGNGVPGNAVANVAGNPISLQAFNHWLYVAAKSQAASAPGAPVIVPNDPPNFANCISQVRKQVPQLAKTPDKQLKGDCQQLFTSLTSQVLNFLIPAYWYQAEAAREHITVTDAQVHKAFEKAKNSQFSNPTQFNAFLSQTGETVQDILYRFRINTIFQKLMAKLSGKVTPKQVAAYYHSHLSQFGSPETRDLRIVLTKTKANALTAEHAVKSGKSWSAVAKKYSTDPTSKNNGGQLIGVRQGQEDHALDAAAFAAPKNKLLGPVKGQFGYYIFEVTKITPAKQQTLAQATPLIEQTLKQQSQANSQKAVDAKVRKQYLSQTVCRSGYSMADCTGYHAPKTPTTPTAPATTTPPPTPPTTSTPPTTTTGK